MLKDEVCKDIESQQLDNHQTCIPCKRKCAEENHSYPYKKQRVGHVSQDKNDTKFVKETFLHGRFRNYLFSLFSNWDY